MAPVPPSDLPRQVSCPSTNQDSPIFYRCYTQANLPPSDFSDKCISCYLDENDLIKAIKNKELDKINAILHQLENDPNKMSLLKSIKDSIGNNALCLATYKGLLDTVQKLLKLGDNIFHKNNGYRTPLHLATNEKHVKVLKELLDHLKRKHTKEINCLNLINKKDEQGYTALHVAITKNLPEAAAILLEHNIDIAAVNIFKLSAMHLAATLGYDDCLLNILKYLIDHPEYYYLTKSKTYKNQTIYDLTKDNPNPEIHDLLNKIKTTYKAKEIFIAALKKKDEEQAIKIFLQKVEILYLDNISALNLALKYETEYVIDYLVDFVRSLEPSLKRYIFSLKDSNNNNCLNLAIIHNFSTYALSLIEEGAEIDLNGLFYATSHAIEFNDTIILKEVLNKLRQYNKKTQKKFLNSKSENNQTVLEMARDHHSAQVVKILEEFQNNLSIDE